MKVPTKVAIKAKYGRTNLSSLPPYGLPLRLDEEEKDEEEEKEDEEEKEERVEENGR